ncbi:hypothetical protein HU200_013614 [Digitaria exilis]|uniref:Protein kinase domain-containing protein n=1 Tax=Digitaria exilis TaxID=1010633 RepID=A0A835FCY5_9POAL|nr:hypothetical protein HU200_013614 [Digitaria exilis]
MDVAVKKFTQEVEDQRYNDFLAEVSIINRLRHKNIVPLVGWSYNKGVPLLVYEYMTNGSLDHHLFRHDRHDPRDARICQWETRYNIVRDIATGLHYVHHEHEPMVLHRPDYAMCLKATRQTDIYSFAVLVLEVVTGKKNADVQPDDDHITDWVWRLHRQGKLLQAVDSILTSGENVILNDEAERLLLLGLAGTNPNPSNRPSMVEAVQIINKLTPMPEVPHERPTFVWPPEDWRKHNSLYRTAMSDWESSSTNTMELVLLSQDLPPSASTGEQASTHNKASNRATF